jgi:hypothetical protein
VNWRAVLDRCHEGKAPMSRQAAHDEAQRLNRRNPQDTPAGPYRCPSCRSYHVGHVPSMESLQSIAEAIRARHQECAA